MNKISVPYISERKNCFQLTIPTPTGKPFCFSYGYLRIGKTEAFKKALSDREKYGFKIWGDYWSLILKDRKFLLRLPRKMEPNYCVASDKKGFYWQYTANVNTYVNDKKINRCVRYSCNKHGKKMAYLLTKNFIFEQYADILELLVLMKRISKHDYESFKRGKWNQKIDLHNEKFKSGKM